MKRNKKRSGFNNNRFAQVPQPKYSRSMFKRTFGNKFTLDEGYLVPVHCDEIYAGDTINLKLNSFVRLTTPITPVMDNLHLDLHAFFVPSRLLMKDYYKMLGEQVNPNDKTDFLVPQIDWHGEGFKEHSLADYFGIPTKVKIPTADLPISLPFRAYNLIYNDWFRDQNLQDSVYFDNGNELDDIDNFPLQRRNKIHDYFTSCLPFAQKGEQVSVSLSGSAPVKGQTQNEIGYANDDGSISGAFLKTVELSNVNVATFEGLASMDNSPVKHYHSLTGATVDLTGASAITVNELREALSIQHILERRARSGTRDVEILQSTYGVSPSDERMQRPELLSVGRSQLNMTTVAQTSETTDNSPLADLSAIGTIQARINVNYSAVENGYLIILASARADISYQQGMPKMFMKRSFLDIMDPLRANLGEQPIKRKEIFMSDNTSKNNEVFGYLPNYDDLRFGRNLITGAFRSNATNSLDIWHFSEEFDPEKPPVLSAEFIQQHSPVKRVLAVQDNPDFFGDVFIKTKHIRVLPVHSIPGLRRF